MMQAPREKPQQLPGVIATVSSGFDLTTRNPWLIVLPLLLDIFYWLGPRLSIQELVQQSAAILSDVPAFTDQIDQIVLLGSQVNLFTSLSIPIIGIPALMSGLVPEQTPVSSAVFQVDGVGLWLVLLAGLSLMGFMLTVTYLNLIGSVLGNPDSEDDISLATFAISLGRSFINLIGLGIVFVVILFIVWLPLLPLAFALGIIAGVFFIAVMIFGVVLVGTYLFLAIPGIVLRKLPLPKAVVGSIRLVHNNMLSTIHLLLIVILINSGMKLLWNLADDGSWLTMISIAGHAFISTALVASIFIYYRDRSPSFIS